MGWWMATWDDAIWVGGWGHCICGMMQCGLVDGEIITEDVTGIGFFQAPKHGLWQIAI